MTQQDHQTAAVATIADLVGLRNLIRGLAWEILRRVLAQTRSARVALDYVEGLLGEVAGNCWQLAQAAGHTTPRRMQELLGSYQWDWKDLRAQLPGLAAAYLSCPAEDVAGPGLAIDQTAHLKKGTRTAGVSPQYAGITGQVENCVTTVFCSYVTPVGHCWVDWEPYLPQRWCADRARRAQARIPEKLRFASKPDLAADIIARQAAAGRLLIRWVAADEVYGRSTRLRTACEDAGLSYVVTVPVDFTVSTPAGEFRAEDLAKQATFQQYSCGTGAKGPCYYDWALLATTSPRHVLLIRRSINNPTKLAYFYCYVPDGTPITLALLVTIAGRRWPVEQDFQLGKNVIGWDTSQVRTWPAYQRHTALAALAMAILTAAHAATTTSHPPPPTLPAPPPHTADADADATEPTIPLDDAPLPTHPDQPCPPDIGLIKLSANELRRLLNQLTSTASHHLKTFALAWSTWRRRHQAIARWHHWRTRLHPT